MSTIHYDARWACRRHAPPPITGGRAASAHVAHGEQRLTVAAPRSGEVAADRGTNASPTLTVEPALPVVLALAAMFPDLRVAALQHMLGRA
ncbi:hypothetical protein OHV05_15090 [Kitasatospora sp. NBC_00070]|uniref:hypothetical protein n=1 Tax=Kitasatospora sp. NBC_00070 TaxID=2975962 RepID=UPI0032504F16